jgi:hypothetical protein
MFLSDWDIGAGAFPFPFPFPLTPFEICFLGGSSEAVSESELPGKFSRAAAAACLAGLFLFYPVPSTRKSKEPSKFPVELAPKSSRTSPKWSSTCRTRVTGTSSAEEYPELVAESCIFNIRKQQNLINAALRYNQKIIQQLFKTHVTTRLTAVYLFFIIYLSLHAWWLHVCTHAGAEFLP